MVHSSPAFFRILSGGKNDKITGFQHSGGQYAGQHVAAELANLVYDRGVDQLDADGQRIEVSVHLFHQEPVQFIGGLVAPDQRLDHVRWYTVTVVMVLVVLAIAVIVMTVVVGYRAITVRRPDQGHARHKLVGPSRAHPVDQTDQVQFQAGHRVPVKAFLHQHLLSNAHMHAHMHTHTHMHTHAKTK